MNKSEDEGKVTVKYVVCTNSTYNKPIDNHFHLNQIQLRKEAC